MIELILLIAGIVYACRRPKLKALTAGDFPGVDAVKFLEWQQAELKSIEIFLWATWGAFAAKIFLMIILSQARLNGDASVAVIIVVLIAWFSGLAVAATYGSKAKKLRLAAGI